MVGIFKEQFGKGLLRKLKKHLLTICTTLGILLAFESLCAFGGGAYGLMGAKAIPAEWLKGSPFHSYFIPSLILFFIVGGSCLTATIAVFSNSRNARRLSFLAGVILLGWIGVQLAIIGFVSWLQPETAVVGIAVLALAWRLPESL